MHEQSKAAKQRFNDGHFHARYFVGKGFLPQRSGCTAV